MEEKTGGKAARGMGRIKEKKKILLFFFLSFSFSFFFFFFFFSFCFFFNVCVVKGWSGVGHQLTLAVTWTTERCCFFAKFVPLLFE